MNGHAHKCFQKVRNFIFSKVPFPARMEGIRETELRTAVGPCRSCPYMGEIPLSARGVVSSLNPPKPIGDVPEQGSRP